MSATITVRELAEIMGQAKTSILRRAKKEQWPYVVGTHRAKPLIVDALPSDLRVRVIQARESAYLKGVILPSRGDIDLNLARELLHKFDSAPPWARAKAEARGEIVDAFKEFHAARALTLTGAKDLFIRRYNSGNDGIGISEGNYSAYPAISRSSLDLWRARKKDMGLAGLLEATTRGKPPGRITDEMTLYIKGIIGKKPHTRPTRISNYIDSKFAGTGVPIPSEATVRRYMNKWKKKNASLFAFMVNPDKWRSDYQAAFGNASEKAEHFLHMVEFDNTPADILCADNNRYTITGAIDIFSRKAMCQVVPTAKAQAVANLMRSIILDWGLFDVMIADNGKDYASRHIEAACGALGVELQFTPPFTPEAKPHIESFFGTLATMLFEELDGYIGHSVADRRAIESRKSFAHRMFSRDEVIPCSLMPDELQTIINTWTEKIYHQRTHGGIKVSPEAKAGESRRPVRKILDERALDILLAPVGTPTVLKKGIRYQNGLYSAIELARHIGKEVEIRRDMADAGKLYVFDADFLFICIAKDSSLEGISVEDANVARKRQKKQVLEGARALKVLAREVGDPMMDLLRDRQVASGQVFSFRREEAFENKAVEEAMKAVVEPEWVETFVAESGGQRTEDRGRRTDEKVVQLHEDRIFESRLERYKYLKQQKKIRVLTEREKGFCEGYEGSDEYYRIFVMPYE